MKTRRILVPVVGIHSAGKSTVRNAIAKLGYETEEECAEILRVNQHLKAGAGADISFEDLVRQAETERDQTRDWTKNDIIIVESWHILTLAYMLTRGRDIQEMTDYFSYVKSQDNSEQEVHCIFLKSDPNKILERSRKLHTEKDIVEACAFYKVLESEIQRCLEVLGFHCQQFNTMKPFEQTMNEVQQFLNEIQGGRV